MAERQSMREATRKGGGRVGEIAGSRPLPPDQLMLATKCGHCGKVFDNPTTAAAHIPVCPVLVRKGL